MYERDEMTPLDEIETFNAQFVGVQGDKIIVMMPKQTMTKTEALTHAAWLVTLADDDDEFQSVLTAVHNT